MTTQAPAPDTTVVGLYAFLKTATADGHMNLRTAEGYRSSTIKILRATGTASADLRHLDIDDVLAKFVTTYGADYTEASLSAYKSRLRSVIPMFLAWANGDNEWHTAHRRRYYRNRYRIFGAPPPATPLTARTFFDIEIPLRDGSYIALARLPVDLTPAEAAHCERVLLAYAGEQR